MHVWTYKLHMNSIFKPSCRTVNQGNEWQHDELPGKRAGSLRAGPCLHIATHSVVVRLQAGWWEGWGGNHLHTMHCRLWTLGTMPPAMVARSNTCLLRQLAVHHRFYIDLLFLCLKEERSYDRIPNFTVRVGGGMTAGPPSRALKHLAISQHSNSLALPQSQWLAKGETVRSLLFC